ncbi:MAG: hypothetical protein V7782_01395, partial [Psychromonas sp.]
MKKHVLLLLTLTPLSFMAVGSPTIGTALVLPGLHEQGVDLLGLPMSSESVIDWEISNSDLVFGAYARKTDNERVKAIGYMYNQKLDLNSSWLENIIRNDAERNGINFEDFFLHFSEDTVIAEVDKTHGENTVLNRKPMIVGYTANQDHAGFWLYQKPPWDADVFENFQQGGALYVYHSEMFDRLMFTFSQFARGGSFTIEYPTAIDANGLVSEWSIIEIKEDKTRNITRNESVIWDLPENWLRATTHDGSGLSYGGGAHFGSTFLQDGGRLYVIRIRWKGEKSDIRPRLKEVKLDNSFPVVNIANAAATNTNEKTVTSWRKIRGFDTAADLNQDNYLSDAEFNDRANKKATARFRWQSRVIPFGKMWNQTSSWALTNLANSDYLQSMQSYYASHWQQQGLNGAYNDDTNKLIGANQFSVHSGGTIEELGLVVGTVEAEKRYKNQFSTFLKKLSSVDSDVLIGVNIGPANLYGRNGQSHLIEAASLYLREHYLFPSTGFSGYGGISKFWDNMALAYEGKSVIFQATTRYGRVEYLGNSEENWKQDQYANLAIYYLNHHPSRSFFSQWNSSYIYGSSNTSSDNFWKSGVAKNIAYQPSSLLNIDLGAPLNQVRNNYEPIPLMLSTNSPTPADYTIVGNSSMNKLVHADLPNG